MPATHTLFARQNPNGIIQTVGEVKGAFSSWDGCMAKGYCKWPVIVGIIIGSLIIISMLLCIGRCLCCGKDLVCCCFRCCDCCQPNRGKHKHLDSVPPTPYNNQYQSHAQPVYTKNAFSGTATFDSGGKAHEDSLPQMPSWDTAASRKIEVLEEPEAHELERLKNNASPSVAGTVSPPARPIPMRNGSGYIGSGPPSPAPAYAGGGPGRSPYGQPSGYGAQPNPYGSRPDLGGRNNSQTALTGDRYNNSPYGAGGAGAGYTNSNTGYGNTSATGYRGDGYANAPSRSPVYPAGSQAQDFGASNNRYDNRSPVNARPAGGNGGYATYNGNNSNNYGSAAANPYSGTSNPYGNRGGTSSPSPYANGYGNNSASNLHTPGARRPAQQGNWRDI